MAKKTTHKVLFRLGFGFLITWPRKNPWRRKQHRYKKAIAGRVGMAEKRIILFAIVPS